ncbi:hypothetical protein [Miniphocaeibacter halophilus]|uniref:Uncharacterized protein n=1 Tax=Miniphocaeibacter halophilus TaxID=2931922 RepID=A0AC61MTT1_9FIRM|nr:hypothetical protein [Miniphocaeibacter halophilus]QQK08942.1 hypothetical protein JFY71_05240 [Miniphocaeibacter halophilus]
MIENLNKIKKLLEVDLICHSLNGRIKYEFSRNLENDNLISITIYADNEKITEEFIPKDLNLQEFIKKYSRNNIHYKINSTNSLEKILLLLNNDIGKNSIKKIKNSMNEEPEWIQYLYKLRVEAEGFTL